MTVERVVSLSIVLVCFGLGVWLSLVMIQRDTARQEAFAWQQSAEQNKAALEAMTDAHARLETVLEEREKALTALEQERNQQRRQLREAMQNDKQVSDWGGTVLPSAVDGMLK